jgi:hypothetical protein
MMIKAMTMLAAEGDRRRADDDLALEKEKKMFMEGGFSVSKEHLTKHLHQRSLSDRSTSSLDSKQWLRTHAPLSTSKASSPQFW